MWNVIICYWYFLWLGCNVTRINIQDYQQKNNQRTHYITQGDTSGETIARVWWAKKLVYCRTFAFWSSYFCNRITRWKEGKVQVFTCLTKKKISLISHIELTLGCSLKFIRGGKRFQVTIKLVGQTDLYHLRNFLCGRQMDAPQETIQALDIVLRESPSLK